MIVLHMAALEYSTRNYVYVRFRYQKKHFFHLRCLAGPVSSCDSCSSCVGVEKVEGVVDVVDARRDLGGVAGSSA